MGTHAGSTKARLDLPEIIPIFPLSGVLLLPGCRLPLRIFEPRYLQMIEDVIEGDRLIGMVQPLSEEDLDPDLQQVGCVGRVASIKQSEDNEYLISLVGVARFEITRELASDKLYRLAEVRWDRLREPAGNELVVDREELVANLRNYFDTHGLEANWRAIEESGDAELVNSLAMVCPFEPTEKQALLEAPDLAHRSRLVIALMSMAVLPEQDSTRVH